MTKLLRRTGEGFAGSDKTGYKSLIIWLSILTAAGIFLFAGTLYSSSWMIVIFMAFIASMLILDVSRLLIDFVTFLYNRASAWWDGIGKEEE